MPESSLDGMGAVHTSDSTRVTPNTRCPTGWLGPDPVDPHHVVLRCPAVLGGYGDVYRGGGALGQFHQRGGIADVGKSVSRVGGRRVRRSGVGCLGQYRGTAVEWGTRTSCSNAPGMKTGVHSSGDVPPSTSAPSLASVDGDSRETVTV